MRRRLMGNSKLKATLVQHLDTQGGEVVFYDIESNAFLYYRLDDGEDIVPKTCVPIGFVAIPASENFYEDYACGIMSLGYMSCSNIEGSKDNEPIMWGNDGILINADDNTNGKINTQKIIEARGALEGLPNPSLAADYPAASICKMYYTEGTKAGDWYLPAVTELTTAVSFLQDLPNVIKKLKSVYSSYKIMNDGLYSVWSSTEYGEQYARWIDSISDDYIGKTVELGVVAFTQIGKLERNYGDIFISGGTVSDIPASGGESQVSGYTYSQTYGYGDSTTNGGTITSGAEISVTSISGDNLGTTETERTKKGESVLTISMNGKTATKTYDVYQEANDWWDGRIQAFWWSDWATYRNVGPTSGEHSIIICCYRHYRSGAEGGGIDVTPSDACSISTSDSSTSISKWEGHYYFHHSSNVSISSRTINIYCSYNGLQSPVLTFVQNGNYVTNYSATTIKIYSGVGGSTDVTGQTKNVTTQGYKTMVSFHYEAYRTVYWAAGNSNIEYRRPTVTFNGTNIGIAATGNRYYGGIELYIPYNLTVKATVDGYAVYYYENCTN